MLNVTKKTEQDQVVEPLGWGFGCIPETDIDGNASARDVCGRPHAEPRILILLTNTADSSCAGIGIQPRPAVPGPAPL